MDNLTLTATKLSSPSSKQNVDIPPSKSNPNTLSFPRRSHDDFGLKTWIDDFSTACKAKESSEMHSPTRPEKKDEQNYPKPITRGPGQRRIITETTELKKHLDEMKELRSQVVEAKLKLDRFLKNRHHGGTTPKADEAELREDLEKKVFAVMKKKRTELENEKKKKTGR